jgi:hypothetical protein
MPFRVEGSRVTLEGHCTVEEAPDLFQALLSVDEPVFALETAATLHTAVAQLILASRGKLTARPAERTLAACLAGLQSSEAMT